MDTAVLITGALGGLGRALVKMSHDLVGIDHIIATDIEQSICDIACDNPKVKGIQMDVASEDSIRNVYDQLHARGTSVKFLINNAGISLFHPVCESSQYLLDKTLKVNTYGSVLTVSTFLDDLIRNKGRVIQISSDSVRIPTLFQPYPDSKIALEAFSSSMRQELQFFGVDLIVIRPGAINTNLVHEMESITNPVQNSKFEKHFETFMKLARANVGSKAEPNQVAEVVKKALTAKKPKKTYTINKNGKISWLSRFPLRWREKIIIKSIDNKMKNQRGL